MLALNVSAVAGDNVVNIAEKAAGFSVTGDAGSQSAATVTVKLGSGTLTATSGASGSWSATVPPGASYLTGTSVGLTVGATKPGYDAATDVTRMIVVDLTAPSVSYTAPASLQVDVAAASVSPTTADTDLASYAATGLPAGLTIHTGTGVISGTPTAGGAAGTATVTVTDNAGNPAEVSVAFPAVDKGGQTLTGFGYSAGSAVFNQTPPTVTAPTGAKTPLSYSAAPPEVCTVDPGSGALSFVGLGNCEITATAAGTANYDAATAMFTVMVESAGVLALNVSAVATDNVVNIAEKTAGFSVSGDAGSQSAATVTVKLGSGTLTATSGSGGSWSADVPPGASYLTGTSVGLTVGVTKTGYSPAADVTRMIVVDLAAPSVSYTAPASLQVDVAASVSPATADTDLESYAATGLPAGLTIDTGTGVISGTPTAAGAGVTVRVTVTDDAGNPSQVSVVLPAVDKGDQPLTGFEYSAGSTAFNQTPPTVTAPTGVKTTLSYSAAAAAVCTVNAGSGALSFVGLGDCEITATAAGTANYNAATATFTVMVESAGVLALNVSAVATDNVVNIAEKATGFSVAGNTGSQDGVAVALEFGSGTLAATSGADGTWSATVAANAGYLTEGTVVLTVGAMKTGYTAAADVVRTVTVDLTAPSVSYTAPDTLQVDVAASVSPVTTDADLESYAATGLPAGLTIDTGTGAISGTPTTAGAAATVTVTVTDDAGNPAGVSVSLPEVLKGDQPLTGFAYSAAAVVYGNAVPTVIPPTGVKTTLSYAATPPEVCTVTAGDGALSLVEVGECVITVTAEVHRRLQRGQRHLHGKRAAGGLAGAECAGGGRRRRGEHRGEGGRL